MSGLRVCLLLLVLTTFAVVGPVAAVSAQQPPGGRGEADQPEDAGDGAAGRDPQLRRALAQARTLLGDAPGGSVQVDRERGWVIASDLPAEFVGHLVTRLARMRDALARDLFTRPSDEDTEDDPAPPRGEPSPDGSTRGRRTPSPSYLTIALPSEARFRELIPNRDHGGSYTHWTRTLLCLELSYTLHHEFVHALHLANATQRQIATPVWLREGLAVCFEDVILRLRPDDTDEPGEAGERERDPDSDSEGSGATSTDAGPRMYEVVPVDNARVDRAKRLARRSRSFDLEGLLVLSDADFYEDHEDSYSRAGYLCRWLHAIGKLGALYEAYAQTHQDDPTGRVALEQALGAELDDIDDDCRDWIRDRPDAQPRNVQPRGVPVLGIRGEDSPRGLRVERVNGAARAADVQVGDLLIEAAGLAIAGHAKLNQALALHEPGDTFALTVWRPADAEDLDPHEAFAAGALHHLTARLRAPSRWR